MSFLNYFKPTGKGEKFNIDFCLEEFQSVLNNLQDAVIIYDNDFNVSVFNSSAESIFNVKASEIIGTSLSPDKAKNPKYTVLIQTLFPSLAPVVYKRTETGVYPQIIDISFPEAQLELRTLTASITLSGGKEGFLKIITDRTKEIESYKSKSRSINITAHELRSPITSVLWALDILRNNTALSNEDKDVAKQGFAAAQKLSKIVSDLLDVSKIEEGKFGYNFQNMDLVNFLKEALNNVREYITKSALKINVYFDYEAGRPIMVNADPNRLGTAVSNILDNAIKYNIENGSITVKIESLKDKPYVQVSVADTGIGVSKEEIASVFNKFSRGQNAKNVGGSGLGLYIAKNIIKRHGGSMRMDSILGRGATVYFTIPTDPSLVPAAEFIYEE